MVPFDELNTQNHQIAELCKVLDVLIQDRSMCDTSIVCELFERFSEKVRAHLDLEEKTIYSKLLTHSDKSINNIALRSLNGSKEIKRIFANYTKCWCKNGLDIYNHEQFVADSGDMFRLVLERIQDEVEDLYPIVRALECEKLADSA